MPRVILLLLLILGIGLVSGCRIYLAPPAPPSPTPPPGFLDVDSLVEDRYLEQPTFSYDGRYLAARGAGGHETELSQLYVVDLTAKQVVYTGTLEFWTTFSFSPMGDTIAACGSIDGPEGIYLIEWRDDLITFLGEGCWPTWSPDGNQLAYVHYETSNQDDLEGLVQIRKRDLSTGSEEVVFEDPDTTNTGWFIVDLVWSQDQRRLAFAAALDITVDRNGIPIPESEVGRLYSMSADGSELLVLTGTDQDVVTPSFLPEEERILYVDRSAPLSARGYYLRLTGLDGHNCLLDPVVPGIRRVTLSPNGKKIAFVTTYGLLIGASSQVLGDAIEIENGSCIIR
jgi:Tol biopolymer transport system component